MIPDTRFPPRGGIEGGGKIELKPEKSTETRKKTEFPFKISSVFVQIKIVLEI